MQKILTIIGGLLGAMLLMTAAYAGSIDRFFMAAPGIPVADGLLEDASDRMVFDSPGGRIVETAATGRVSWSKVADFYVSTLPQLGWRLEKQSEDGLQFVREKERLYLHRQAGTGATMRMNLVIRPSN